MAHAIATIISSLKCFSRIQSRSCSPFFTYPSSPKISLNTSTTSASRSWLIGGRARLPYGTQGKALPLLYTYRLSQLSLWVFSHLPTVSFGHNLFLLCRDAHPKPIVAALADREEPVARCAASVALTVVPRAAPQHPEDFIVSFQVFPAIL
jgi:hypothetical protein